MFDPAIPQEFAKVLAHELPAVDRHDGLGALPAARCSVDGTLAGNPTDR
jgi:hypothetical protein